MRKEEILKKAIEKAVKNGFNMPVNFISLENRNDEKIIRYDSGKSFEVISLFSLIFDHDFAKAFFGEDLLCYDCGERVSPPSLLLQGKVQLGTGNCYCNRQFENNEPAWQYHLQQMVLEEYPILYLEQYL